MSRFEAISLDIEGSRDELPLGLGVNSVTLSGVRSQFLRAFGSLFYAGQPGHLALAAPQYCFADTAGTIPAVLGGQVARVNSPVPGQPYLVQETAAARLTMGRHPSGGIRNLATGAAAVTNATYWPSPVTSNGVTRTIVGTGVEAGEQWIEYRFQGTPTTGNNSLGYSTNLSRTSAAIGQTWTASARLQVVAGDASRINVMRVGVGEETAPSTLITVQYSAGAPTNGTENLATVSRVLTTGNQVRVEANIVFLLDEAVDVTVRVRGLQLEQAATRSAYQANFGPFDITEAGIPDAYYLQGDGVDDHMTTSDTVNMSTLTKARLVAGLEKFTDVNSFYAVSHGLDASGGNLSINKTAGNAQWTARSRGTGGLATSTALAIAAPDRAVLTADVNRATNFLQLRYNNAAQTASAVALGGSGLNATLAVLAQPSGALPMNGRWYGHAYADMTDADLARVQQYFASRLGETLT